MISPSKLFTIMGGKWTTYRKMGEDMIDKVEKEFGWKQTITTTGSLRIHGFTEAGESRVIHYIITEVIKHLLTK